MGSKCRQIKDSEPLDLSIYRRHDEEHDEGAEDRRYTCAEGDEDLAH